MGFANSDAIKGIIDFGTTILDIFNKIISTISGTNGLTKSITSLGLGIGTFKLGRNIFGKGGFLGSLLGGKEVGEKFGKSFIGGAARVFKTSRQGELGANLASYNRGFFA